MPPAETPLRQQIMQGMADQLFLIQGGDKYYHRVKKRELIYTDPDTEINVGNTANFPQFSLQPLVESAREKQPANRMRSLFEVMVIGATWARRARWIEAEHLAADIEVAIQSDITLGGIVIDTWPGETVISEHADETIKALFVNQVFGVRYIRQYGKPWRS